MHTQALPAFIDKNREAFGVKSLCVLCHLGGVCLGIETVSYGRCAMVMTKIRLSIEPGTQPNGMSALQNEDPSATTSLNAPKLQGRFVEVTLIAPSKINGSTLCTRVLEEQAYVAERTSSQAEANMLVRPITYHLEISQDSIKSEPVVHLESSTPFQPFAIGDKMSWNGFRNARWHPEPQTGQLLRVKDVLHFIWDIRGSNIGHKIRLCVEICNFED